MTEVVKFNRYNDGKLYYFKAKDIEIVGINGTQKL